jgi:GT2 family glycosyltransferase
MRHGLFRENLGRGGPAAHEDTELGYRLHQYGLRIFYKSAALGYHHHMITREKACLRAYEQGSILMNSALTRPHLSFRWLTTTCAGAQSTIICVHGLARVGAFCRRATGIQRLRSCGTSLVN